MKLKTIIIRGVKIKVNEKNAKKFEAMEKELIQKDWDKNQLD